jgi:hypothetical protein
MSDITAIDPTALNPPPLPSAAIPSATVPTGRPRTPSSNAAQPAVVVSLSSGAAASLQAAPTTLSLDPDQVDNALSSTAEANRLATKAADSNEADVATAYGTAIAGRDTDVVIGAAVGSASQALYYAANLGIPILDSVSPGAVKNGAAPGTSGVGAFTFTHGGSAYAVMPGPDGTLVGTKDGHPWKTWHATRPVDAAGAGMGETAASQTLASHTAEQEALDDKPLAGIDVSA